MPGEEILFQRKYMRRLQNLVHILTCEQFIVKKLIKKDKHIQLLESAIIYIIKNWANALEHWLTH